ncbi:hypothetical protein MSPP1_003350 [Malassezia sp. CBS 17886]|nr:hypothetical protein MSPP1_003350 [Malassezia sp. CBS 17886]
MVFWGIAWDDFKDGPGRGKHDGVGPDGTQYFDCAAKHGSFLGPTAPVDWGTSLYAALHAKYGDASQPATALRRLRNVSLTGLPDPPAPFDPSAVHVACVCEPGVPMSAITDAAPSASGERAALTTDVTTLDLSRSLLPSWDAAADAARAFPALHTLILQQTRLTPPTRRNTLPHLTHLELDACAMSWDEVRWSPAALTVQMMRIACDCPALQTLQFGHNGVEALASIPCCGTERGIGTGSAHDAASPRAAHAAPHELPLALGSVSTLNLEGNRLTSWADVSRALAALPNLRKLVLTDNDITTITPPSHPDPRSFPVLTEVVLVGNPISSWRSVEALAAWIPQPFQLTLGNAPVMNGEPSARLVAIARVPQLVALDHTRVSDAERTDAERYYVAQIRTRGGSLDDVRAKHPRYEELCARHGVDAALLPPPPPPTLHSRLVAVRAFARRTAPTPDDAAEIAQGHGVPISVSRTMPTLQLTRRVAAVCDVHWRPQTQMWAVLQPGAHGAPILEHMADATRDAAWYGVQAGDSLVVVG